MSKPLKKMTRKDAIEVLMKMAFRFHHGVGVGISSGITDRDRALIEKAIKTIWPYLYKREMTDADWFNLPSNSTYFKTYQP